MKRSWETELGNSAVGALTSRVRAATAFVGTHRLQVLFIQHEVGDEALGAPSLILKLLETPDFAGRQGR